LESRKALHRIDNPFFGTIGEENGNELLVGMRLVLELSIYNDAFPRYAFPKPRKFLTQATIVVAFGEDNQNKFGQFNLPLNPEIDCQRGANLKSICGSLLSLCLWKQVSVV